MRSVLALALGLAACAPRAPAGPAATPAATPTATPTATTDPAGQPAAEPAGPGTTGSAGVSGRAPDATAQDSAEPADAVVAAIEQAVNDTRAARHACWARGAADDYRLAGRVTLRVQLGAGGAPVVTVRDDEPRDPVLTQCLVALYERHAWPDGLAPGTAVELPFAFQAPRYQYTVQAEHVPPGQDADGARRGRVLLDAANTGNDDIAVVLVELTPTRGRADMRLLADPLMHARTTVIFYVIDGQAEIASAEIRRRQVMSAGQAISIPPGTPYALHATEAPATVVQIFVPAGPARALRGQPAPGATPTPATDTTTAPPRGHGYASLPAVQAAPRIYPIAAGQGEVGLYFDRASGHAAASLATLTARPGMRIPAHAHARETEMVLVLAGTGTMTIDGDTYPIAPMTAIQIPPGVEHAVVVSGPEPLRALQVYTPSGPEQRFKQPPQR